MCAFVLAEKTILYDQFKLGRINPHVRYSAHLHKGERKGYPGL